MDHKEDTIGVAEIQVIQKEITKYHGSSLISNITDLACADLLAKFDPLYGNKTISQMRKALVSALKTESVVLQSKKFQEALQKGIITRGVGRLDENKRKELHKHYHVYELLQIAFSRPEHYFQLQFKSGDKAYNRQLFSDAIDFLVIDPTKVPQSSLNALGIRQLDPDCQNLKEVFKKMHSLCYQTDTKKKYTPTINEYDGKFITLSSQSRIFEAGENPTQGEKRKEDISVQMAVYTDLFSMLRREGHILDTLDGKKHDYNDIKKELIGMVKEIDRNQKAYGASVPSQVRNIIQEIDAATSAQIVAQKVYNLYKVQGRHVSNDRKLLLAAITRFTKRIGELIGISAHVQLHALELEDQLEDQRLSLELFHAQIEMGNWDLALQNYTRGGKKSLHEPFLSFDQQITYMIDTKGDAIKGKLSGAWRPKVLCLVTLQKKLLQIYQWEHEYKVGDSSPHDIKEAIEQDNPSRFTCEFPELYQAFFADMDKELASFDVNFTYEELTYFFAGIKNMGATVANALQYKRGVK